MYLKTILRDWRKKYTPMGMFLDEHHIYSLEFADDQAILAKDGDDIDYMLKKLRSARTNIWAAPLAIIRKCVICFKANPVAQQPIMGDLSNERIEPARPVVSTGVDYCGSLLIRDGIRKRAARVKAKKELQHLQDIELKSHKVADFLSSEGIEWYFIQLRAPHFGGVWEAHFKRIVGNSLLTYEELHTISVQVESILNSRPLTPMSEDMRDVSVLTPGHFLVCVVPVFIGKHKAYWPDVSLHHH
ncbi:hypothetical protein Trydic_g77 [Trypoxylus dichotomus]